MKFECVHTFPAVLRTRTGLGQKVIMVCPGYATVCDGTFPVYPQRLRCVQVRPVRPWLCPTHRWQGPGVTTVIHGSRMAKPQCCMVAYDYQLHSCGIYNTFSFARYRTQVTYQGKKEQQ